jgi:NAD(P)-dependent dehydrogenase (short-subunit alcohol dehydrogenase family)
MVVRKAVAALGGLDILICNVGSGRSVPPGKEDAREWQRVFGINLWSATNLVEAAQKYLVASKGAVVCVSSICGLEVVQGAPVTYSAAKAGLHAMIRGLARPLGKMGIRINGVAAGNIIHGNSIWAKKLQKQPLQTKKFLSKEVALERLGKPEEVADPVAFLASRRASFATGAVWVLDGGQNRS